jgi:hypothetical protein
MPKHEDFFMYEWLRHILFFESDLYITYSGFFVFLIEYIYGAKRKISSQRTFRK